MTHLIFLSALLLLISIVLSKTSHKFGTPSLLLFLITGMLAGSEGIGGIEFDDYQFAQFVGNIALIFIIYSGGLETKFSTIRPVLTEGIILSTLGVLLSVFAVGGFVYLVTDFSLLVSLLIGAIVSSTDAAAVFGVFRSRKMGLKHNLRPLLELESGSNDPMAYMLTILLIGVVTNSQGGGGLGMSALYFVVQLVVGTLSGYLIGRLAVWTINKINLANHSLYSVLLLAFIFFAFAFTDLVKGNGYLAVYLAGLVVGNHKLAQKRSLTVFFDGFTWLMQIVMFLTLGLFVNSDELLRPEVLILGGAVGAFMILVARPVTVFACLLPFRRFTTKARLYVSWVGLRGAVPILFAIYPMMAGVEHAELLFNVVFLSTIISLLVQGTTVSGMANLLGLAYEERESAFNVEMHEEMKSALTEVEVNENLLASGHTLKDITLPENTLVMMVCRDGEYFVPQGKTELKLGDKLLVISDRSEELASTYKDMGIDDVMKLG